MSEPDYDVWYDEDIRSWVVVNYTKWGTKYLAEISGPGAELWARKYLEWLELRDEQRRGIIRHAD